MKKKILSKNDVNSNQLAIALHLLKLLSEKPLKLSELVEALSPSLDDTVDPSQKVVRLIRKLRDCGFEINSAPNRPYELMESNFPLILSQEQRQALSRAAHLMSEMGFSAPAAQIFRIVNISDTTEMGELKADFSPPVDYSENQLDECLHQLQERISQKRRFVIRYRSSQGEEKNWDLDKSELRLHDGVLYLFAFVPDSRSWHIEKQPNAEQNYIFRIDRILKVYPASNTSWIFTEFPKLEIVYRLKGPLWTYKTRRPHEQVICRNETDKFADVSTCEDYIFWFRQRIFRYGSNARVLTPEWLAQDIGKELQKASAQYHQDA